jgi:hypothetical protein
MGQMDSITLSILALGGGGGSSGYQPNQANRTRMAAA